MLDGMLVEVINSMTNYGMACGWPFSVSPMMWSWGTARGLYPVVGRLSKNPESAKETTVDLRPHA